MEVGGGAVVFENIKGRWGPEEIKCSGVGGLDECSAKTYIHVKLNVRGGEGHQKLIVSRKGVKKSSSPHPHCSPLCFLTITDHTSIVFNRC